MVSEPTTLTGCGCVSDRRPIDYPERRDRTHAGRDQRKNRCPVYQDREADRRSAAKGNESRACTGKEAGVLPLILNIRKVTRGYIHFVAYLFPALLAPFPGCLDCFPKSLKVISWYWSFCHIHSPYYILLFTFLFGYVYTVLSVSQNNSQT